MFSIRNWKFVIRNSRASFTLIELLVVLAIVAILSVVVILTLNPAELIKQARDSNRLSDFSTLNSALGLFNTDVNAGFMGTSSVVYVSIPDTTSTCANLGLPTLPTGYIYNCVTSTSTKNIDGTGWIPVNFKLISFGNPLSSLPVDPVNTTSSRNYYTYVSGGSWDLSATLEASKNKLGGTNDRVSTDGGTYPDLYETGSKLTLLPVDYGDTSLVGYWNFEESSGGSVKDLSGNGNNGTWYGSGTRYVAGKAGSWAGQFVSSTVDYISVPASPSTYISASLTLSAWVNPSILPTNGQNRIIVATDWATGHGHYFQFTGDNRWFAQIGSSLGWQSVLSSSVSIPHIGVWTHIVATWNGSVYSLYADGVLISTGSAGGLINIAVPLNFAKWPGRGGEVNYSGLLDDIRFYNRALSAAEISALYNATK